jgi:RNA polymerase sigma-70 factor (ECF subfamily)
MTLLADEPAAHAALPDVAEQHLLTRLQAGEPGAFDDLYRTYVPHLLDYAERYVSADVADDIVQSVLAAVWRRGQSFTVRSTVAAYLFGAIRREVLHRERHLRVVRRTEADDDFREPLTPMPAPDAGASLNELRAALRSALDALPARTRDVLTLRWVEELQYDEIAEVLGISVSAAKMHVHRAQPIVRPLLERFRER